MTASSLAIPKDIHCYVRFRIRAGRFSRLGLGVHAHIQKVSLYQLLPLQ